MASQPFFPAWQPRWTVVVASLLAFGALLLVLTGVLGLAKGVGFIDIPPTLMSLASIGVGVGLAAYAIALIDHRLAVPAAVVMCTGLVVGSGALLVSALVPLRLGLLAAAMAVVFKTARLVSAVRRARKSGELGGSQPSVK
jgi:hypothetical protein